MNQVSITYQTLTDNLSELLNILPLNIYWNLINLQCTRIILDKSDIIEDLTLYKVNMASVEL